MSETSFWAGLLLENPFANNRIVEPGGIYSRRRVKFHRASKSIGIFKNSNNLTFDLPAADFKKIESLGLFLSQTGKDLFTASPFDFTAAEKREHEELSDKRGQTFSFSIDKNKYRLRILEDIGEPEAENE